MALKKLGYEAIVVNSNPETVSTDYSMSDKLYFEPLTVEDVIHVIEKEKVNGVVIQFGGQTAINLAAELNNEGVHIYGSSVETIDLLEDRELFYGLLDQLSIPHITGEIATDLEHLKTGANRLGYPVLVRPSYVIGGQSMKVIYTEEELEHYVESMALTEKRTWPPLIDRYISGLE